MGHQFFKERERKLLGAKMSQSTNTEGKITYFITAQDLD